MLGLCLLPSIVAAVNPSRGLAIVGLAGMLLGVATIARRDSVTVGRAILAGVIASPGAVLILGAAQNSLSIPLSGTHARMLLFVSWAGIAATLGSTIALTLLDRRSIIDTWLRLAASLAAGSFFIAALARLLLPSRGSADRLGWLLYDEDNAAFVGVAREVLSLGPEGGRLAAEFGAAFANLPAVLVTIAGGPIESEVDLRLQAITLTVVSAIVAATLGLFAMAMIGSLAHHVHARADDNSPRRRVAHLVSGPLLAGATAFVGLAVLVALPLRSGFLTLLWGLSLVAVAAAYTVLTPLEAKIGARLSLVAVLVAVGVLLVGTWPFIGPALVPVLLVVAGWPDWKRIASALRARPAVTVAAVAAAVAMLAVGTSRLLATGAAANVIAMGSEALTIGGTSISPDRISASLGVASLFLVGLLGSGLPQPSRRIVMLGIWGPALGAGTLYLGLRVAANLLTDGVLAYAGTKLLYALFVLVVILGMPMLVALSTQRGHIMTLVATVIVVIAATSSSTVVAQTDWWERTDRGLEPHAVATISAIQRTNEELPLRCLPSEGTTVTDRTRWAAYMCIRWTEEAFNGSGWGYAGQFLFAEGPTFDDVVRTRLESRPSDYLFAFPFTMGPGWFGWDGTNPP